ncbi:MAG: hypothetical protein AAF677_18730 [Pseudomonadota bacterium]
MPRLSVMTALDEGGAAADPLAALLAVWPHLVAHRAAAHRRRPDGAALRGYAWCTVEGALVLFPTHPMAAAGPALAAAWHGSVAADPAARYWVAHALRQAQWRAWAATPGPGPVVLVAAAGVAVDMAGATDGRLARRRCPARRGGPRQSALDCQTLAQALAWGVRRARA